MQYYSVCSLKPSNGNFGRLASTIYGMGRPLEIYIGLGCNCVCFVYVSDKYQIKRYMNVMIQTYVLTLKSV